MSFVLNKLCNPGDICGDDNMGLSGQNLRSLSFQSELLQQNSGRRAHTSSSRKGSTHICSVNNGPMRSHLEKLFSQFVCTSYSSHLTFFPYYHLKYYTMYLFTCLLSAFYSLCTQENVSMANMSTFLPNIHTLL